MFSHIQASAIKKGGGAQQVIYTAKEGRFKIEIKLSFFFRKNSVNTNGKTQSNRNGAAKMSLCQVGFI